MSIFLCSGHSELPTWTCSHNCDIKLKVEYKPLFADFSLPLKSDSDSIPSLGKAICYKVALPSSIQTVSVLETVIHIRSINVGKKRSRFISVLTIELKWNKPVAVFKEIIVRWKNLEWNKPDINNAYTLKSCFLLLLLFSTVFFSFFPLEFVVLFVLCFFL